MAAESGHLCYNKSYMSRAGEQTQIPEIEPKKSRFWPQALKITGILAIAAIVFGVGFGFGSGQISIGSVSNSANASLPVNLNYASVEQVYDLLRTNYDGKLDQTKIMDGLKAGLVAAAGNPYTQYLSKQEAKDFSQEMSGMFTGIGAKLDQGQDGTIVIIAPIDGFPASKAGLRAKDVITSIDGKSTKGMSVEKAVTKIRGKKDTKVMLGILRGKEQLSFTITRDDIQVPSVEWEVLDGNIGYIQISQFGDDTTVLMNTAARELKKKDVKGIVLDLRDNPGGLLSAAVHVSSWWLPAETTVLQEKRAGVKTNDYTSDGTKLLAGIPTVVLINGGSASASEIVAGALKDYKVATLYGEKSYGKGSVQDIYNVPGGGAVKITVARWYRPNGQNIDKKGIKPDVEIKLSDADYKSKNDRQKQAALDFLRK